MKDMEVKLQIKKHNVDRDMIEIYSKNRFGDTVLWGVVHSDILPYGVDYSKGYKWDARLIFGEE